MMTNEQLAELQAEGQAYIAKAKEIAERHAGDPSSWPADVLKTYNENADAAGEILKQIRVAKDDLAIIAKAKEIGEAIGEGLDGPAGSSKGNSRLSFKHMGATAARSILGGQKALAPSGATVVAQEFQPDVVALGQPALSLTDVLPVVQHDSPEVAWLQQSTRTNNAAVVPAGTLKPTSVYSVVRQVTSLAVIATLSEGVPRHWLLDSSSVEAWLDSELRYSVATAVEAKTLADINGTSGIQAQAYVTSPLVTMRSGITKLEQAAYTAAAFVLTPADWAGIEIALSSTNAVEHLSLPYDPAARRLFGVPVVTTNAQAAGVGHVLADGAVAIHTDTRGVDVTFSENATQDSFGKNLIFARCEGRFATSVYSPLGVVSLDLTA